MMQIIRRAEPADSGPKSQVDPKVTTAMISNEMSARNGSATQRKRPNHPRHESRPRRQFARARLTPVTIDIKAMLHRVAAEVFDENFTVGEAPSGDYPSSYAVRVISHIEPGRTAIIRASYVWMDAFIPELNVQASSTPDEDDEEQYKEEELRRICLVMLAYLRGDGRIEQRRRLFRRGTLPVLIIDVDGRQWRLRRNHWSVR